MQYFDILIAPNETRKINVKGSYVYFLSGSAGGGDSSITLRKESGSDTVILRPGQSFRNDKDDDLNSKWLVGNYSGQSTINGILLIGDGDFNDNRISGSVEVIDGAKSRTIGLSAFIGLAGSAPVIGEYSKTQLWNPVGSGKRLIIEFISGTGSVSGKIDLHGSIQQMAASNGLINPKSKLIGSIDSIAELRTLNSIDCYVGTGRLTGFYFAENGKVDFNFKEPIILNPGTGLVAASEIGKELFVNIEYFEENI